MMIERSTRFRLTAGAAGVGLVLTAMLTGCSGTSTR